MMNHIKTYFKQKVSAKYIKGQHERIQGTIWLKRCALNQWFSTQIALRPVFLLDFFPRPVIEDL